MTTEIEILSTEMVAERLVQLCREGRNFEVIENLYSDNILSIEPMGSSKEITEGKSRVRKKIKAWVSRMDEITDVQISDPIVSGSFFSCSMNFDISLKGGRRHNLNEICVFEVQQGKIILEQFFYRDSPLQ